MKQYKNYTSVITKPIKVQSSTDRHNTLCSYPDCYSNCHVPCQLNFALDPKDLVRCYISKGDNPTECRECGHPVADHRHYNSIWKTEHHSETVTDRNAKKKYLEATEDNAMEKMAVKGLQSAIETMKQDIAEATAAVGKLTESYAQLSLSGSFAGLVKKSVRLLQTNLENMRSNGTDDATIRSVEQSLNNMEGKLKVVEAAARQAPKSESYFGKIAPAPEEPRVVISGLIPKRFGPFGGLFSRFVPSSKKI